MTDAVIVSTARTPIGKAYRGALNNTEGPTMAGHVSPKRSGAPILGRARSKTS
jgi:acetyl-CoA C-acetyltransferase